MGIDKNVTEGNFNAILGQNIRKFRKARGLTQLELAERIEELGGGSVSACTVGCWERGSKCISAVHLHYVSLALSCTEQALYGYYNWATDARLHAELSRLPESTREIMLYMLTNWAGDSISLLECNWLYMSILDTKLRADISGMCLVTWEHAKERGLVDTTFNPNLEELERRWSGLLV